MELNKIERRLLKYIVNHPGQFTSNQIARKWKCSSALINAVANSLFDKHLISACIPLNKMIYWEPYEPLIETKYIVYISDTYKGKTICHFTTNIPAIYSYNHSQCNAENIINLIQNYCIDDNFIEWIKEFTFYDISKAQHYYIDVIEEKN